jgi:uncharacterized protein (UPF0335 family)
MSKCWSCHRKWRDKVEDGVVNSLIKRMAKAEEEKKDIEWNITIILENIIGYIHKNKALEREKELWL